LICNELGHIGQYYTKPKSFNYAQLAPRLALYSAIPGIFAHPSEKKFTKNLIFPAPDCYIEKAYKNRRNNGLPVCCIGNAGGID